MKTYRHDQLSLKEKPFAMLEARILTSFIRRMTIDPLKTLAPYIKTGMKVLDYGCGMGFFSLPAASLTGATGKTVCVDINDRMLEKLKKKARDAGVSDSIETRLLEDSTPLSETDNFDFAFSVAVIHEIPGAQEIIDAIFKSLKPGGTFLLAEPKGHVSKNLFQLIADLCVSCGFNVALYPKVSIHNAVLLKKPIA
jgi:2-polyprenyl-3-methyl-5-hydroxy-6-metoxy-1,4-benzoquinol methylase